MDWNSFISRLNSCNPVLAAHLQESQSSSLADYSNTLWREFAANLMVPGRAVFIEHLAKTANSYSCAAAELAEQVARYPLMLSVHHTAPMWHPVGLQSLLFATAGGRAPKVLPVLATDWVPMDNLFYPRGLLVPKNGALASYNLFAKSSRKKAVAVMPAFDLSAVEKVEREVLCDVQQGAISSQHYEALQAILSSCYRNEQVLAQASYRHQCALINRLLWQTLFPESRLCYLNISDIIIPLLKTSLSDPQSLISQLLFNKELRNAVIQRMNGMGGCWDRQKHSGSLLFWQMQQGKMQPLLNLQNNCLSGATYSLQLDPEHIVRALDNGEIVPGMFLIFMQLMYGSGVACVGGMRQIAYNRIIRDGLAEVLDRAHSPLVEQVCRFPVQAFAAGVNAVLSAANTPAGILDLWAEPELLSSAWQQRSLKEVILACADELMTLSA